MYADTIIINLSKIYTPEGPFKRGLDMNQVKEYSNAFIAIKDGLIMDIGDHKYESLKGPQTNIYDGRNLIGLPGFIDSHTHLVYGGSRENEFAQKLDGVAYLDILKQGGGILSSVRHTRLIPQDRLLKKSMGSLYELASYGVTSVEIKSGYGLDHDTEIKQLQVIDSLKKTTPFTIQATYLGAHAIPEEYKDKKQDYIEFLKSEMALIKGLGLADYVDVFCEDHVFGIEDTKQLLDEATKLGFKIRLHADEIVSLGGAGLGIGYKANSVDHLLAIKEEDIKLLGKSTTVANLLPGTAFYLNKDYADARTLIKNNAIVSISSDLNPGSSPNENFQLIQQLACLKMKMTPQEVLCASTINPAFSMDLQDKLGSLEIGKEADIILMDAPNLEYIFYHYGVNHVKDIFKTGKLIFKNRSFIKESLC
jgi:imidazolonepropionase